MSPPRSASRRSRPVFMANPRRPIEHWTEAEIDGWRVACRYAVQAARVVVSELRVYPLEPEASGGRFAGEWRGAADGIGATVPTGGLTLRLLRGAVALGEHVRVADAAIRREQQWPVGSLERKIARAFLMGPLIDVPLVEKRSPPAAGRPQVPEADLVRVAVAYVAAVRARSARPGQDAADRLGLSAVRVRDLLYT